MHIYKGRTRLITVGSLYVDFLAIALPLKERAEWVGQFYRQASF